LVYIDCGNALLEFSIMRKTRSSAHPVAQGDKLTTPGAGVGCTAGLVVVLGTLAAGTAHAQTVGVFDRSFPESVTSTADGALYVAASISAAW
jgi:hypothetical protein